MIAGHAGRQGTLGRMAMPAYIPSPPINSFHLGPLVIHFYALMYLVGIAAAG